MDYSPQGSSVHEILQARILEWVAIPFSRGSFWSRDWTQVSYIEGRFFTIWATIWTRSSDNPRPIPTTLNWIWSISSHPHQAPFQYQRSVAPESTEFLSRKISNVLRTGVDYILAPSSANFSLGELSCSSQKECVAQSSWTLPYLSYISDRLLYRVSFMSTWLAMTGIPRSYHEEEVSLLLSMLCCCHCCFSQKLYVNVFFCNRNTLMWSPCALLLLTESKCSFRFFQTCISYLSTVHLYRSTCVSGGLWILNLPCWDDLCLTYSQSWQVNKH